MKKVNLLFLSLISLSILNAQEPSRLDYILAGLRTSHIDDDKALEYECKSNEFAKKSREFRGYGCKEIKFDPNKGPTAQDKDLQSFQYNSVEDKLVYTNDWQPLFFSCDGKILGIRTGLGGPTGNGGQSVNYNDLITFLKYHSETKTKLTHAVWSKKMTELVSGDFFKVIDKISCIYLNSGVATSESDYDSFMVAHENVIKKAAFEVKSALGVIVLVAAIGLSIKPLYKKIKEKQRNNEETVQQQKA